MSSYSVIAMPSTTVGVMAGMILIGSAFAELHGRDETMDRVRPITRSTFSTVNVYAETLKSPTRGLSYGVATSTAEQDLQAASLAFVKQLGGAMETLGGDYLEIAEDNFWDLVLR